MELRGIRFLLLAFAFCFAYYGSCSLLTDAAVVERTFHVGNLTINRLCENRVITAVNGQLPGPMIEVTTGDNVLVHVINESPYDLTIHWHGVDQRLTPWADGPSMITQCPIRPGHNYTYNFTITGQEGTLFWHAHITYLRATVYGALIIRPKNHIYPSFPRPFAEVPIVIGEWWNANVEDVHDQGYLTGGLFNNPNAYTINGQPGDLLPCSSKNTYKLNVIPRKTYMLRIINAALSTQHFFKVAGHTFTIVAVDGSYTTPYNTDVIVIASGQTVDALMIANAPPANYYMAAKPYDASGGRIPFNNNTATGIIIYRTTKRLSTPIMPTMPVFNDSIIVDKFFTELTSLVKSGLPTVPLNIDERMFITVNMGLHACAPDQLLCDRVSASGSMNNVSFTFPTSMSILEAHYKNVSGVYTTDFPDNPPMIFDYVNSDVNSVTTLMPLRFNEKGTKVKNLKFNSTIEIVLQNTAILGVDYHPMHLHGYSFFVVAQGVGNYNAIEALPTYNLVNPQLRNTVAVPAGGWSVIRFRADNPGVWIMHCHLEQHVPIGLLVVFEVEDGPTPETRIPPPPADFPTC